MIISHRYKFIYLRTEKTASTSLTEALVNVVDQEDTVVRSFSGDWLKYMPAHPGKLKRVLPRVFGLHPHASAKHVRDIVGRKIFDSYYKFAVERNPWERQVSLYHHREFRRKNETPNFDKDMSSAFYRMAHHTRLKNWDIYAIGKKIVADKVLKYEDLSKELPQLFERLGISGKVELPRSNTSYAGDRPHYSTYYSENTRNVVGRWYRREIEALAYEFEDKSSPTPV